ncbi:MAG TPA: MFS transporter [bacterium]|nr:MFS transporter [bacterium]
MFRRTAFAQWIDARLCFYGWPMLGLGVLCMLGTGPGQSYTIGLFFGPLIRELHLSSTMLAAVYGLGTAFAALGLTYTGRLVDRYGPRRLIATIAFLLGGVCLAFPLARNVVALFFAFTFVRFLGQGSLSLSAVNLVSQWFSRRRGLALSVTSLGFAVGLAAYPPVVERLIATVGWRQTWVWMGLWVWMLLIPAVLLLMIDRPDDLGLLPDGVRPSTAAATDPAGPADPPAVSADEVSWTPREALHTHTFWILAVAMAIPSALITGMYIYHVQYFLQQGLSARLAADMFSVTSVSMVVAMLLFGLLLDRLPTRFVLAGGILINGVALGVMYNLHDTFTAVIYAMLLGVTSGGAMTNANYVWPRYFGRRHLGGIQGPALTIGIIGASLGALPFGIAYDLLGSYHAAVGLLAFLPLGFGIAVAFLKPPQRPAAAATAAAPTHPA